MAEDLSIIIVDDMQFSRAVLRSGLMKEGYEDIRLAASAQDALEMIQERNADVVLADWIMPEMDGIQMTQRIRQMDEERNRYTSVIVITGKEGEEGLIEAFEKGVDDYLTKPVNVKEMAARVHAAGRIATLQNTLLITSSALSAANMFLEGLNTTDPLTGTGNQRFVTHQLEALLKEKQARGGGVCLALVDLDNFQDINNEYSYESGDEVLRAVSKRLRRAVRPLDVVGRINADEFALVLNYGKDEPFRPNIFARIGQAIRQRHISTSEGDAHINFCMGIYCFNSGDGAKSVQEIWDAAHRNLKKAKEKGTGQIILTRSQKASA